MKRLLKLIKNTKNYEQFEKRVVSFLRWYEVPFTWTKKDLERFYYNNGGK